MRTRAPLALNASTSAGRHTIFTVWPASASLAASSEPYEAPIIRIRYGLGICRLRACDPTTPAGRVMVRQRPNLVLAALSLHRFVRPKAMTDRRSAPGLSWFRIDGTTVQLTRRLGFEDR